MCWLAGPNLITKCHTWAAPGGFGFFPCTLFHDAPFSLDDDNDDVHYFIGERLKLEREVGNMGV